MTTKNEMKAKLEKLCYIIPQFRVWTGQTVLREEDFRLGENGSLPPKGVIAELGMKNTVDPKTLNIFTAIKRRAYRLLEDYGINWMGGFAVPVDRADELIALLDQEVREFEDATVAFLRDYDAHVDKWIQANPEFADQLRSAVKPSEYVRNRFHAGYVAARLQPLSDTDKSFDREVDGLSNRLFESVSQLADRFFKDTLSNKSVCRSAETLLKIRNKLDGLRFLDSRISPILELVDRVVSHLPSKGSIEGPVFWELTACILLLSDQEKMKAAANGQFDLDALTQALTPASEQAPLFDVPPENVSVPVATPQPDAGQHSVRNAEPTQEEETLPLGFFDDVEAFFHTNDSEPEAPAKSEAKTEPKTASPKIEPTVEETVESPSPEKDGSDFDEYEDYVEDDWTPGFIPEADLSGQYPDFHLNTTL